MRAMMIAALALVSLPARAEMVGEIGTDWSGNDIVVEAIQDPKVAGVTCHLSYFERGLIDRLQQGNWFEDPSNSSIACRQTGPVTIGDIDLDEDGEVVFSERRSLVFKSLVVRRLYDRANDTLVYVAYAQELEQGSAKMALSTVPLYDAKATWEEGMPAP